MHRTLHGRPALLVGGLILGLLCSTAAAQPPAPLPGVPLVVPAGTKPRLQMTTKKDIKSIKNTRENVLTFRQVPGDPSTIELIPGDAGVTQLTLTDVDGKTDTYDVLVQADVEFLRIQLKRLIPNASIEPVPISNTVIILRGTVSHIEDVARATNAIAAASPGMQVLSDLRIAGDQQVQLCVTVAQVSRSQLRSMDFNFLTNSKNFFLGSTVGNAVAEPPLVGVGSALNGTLFGQTLAGIPGSPNGVPTNLLFGVIHDRWGFLGFLEALRTEGVVKTLNEPTVTTMSGRPASFLVGGEQAIPVPAGLGQIGVQFEEFGTRLNVIPIVLGNGKIHLEIEPEVSELNAANGTSIDGVVVPGRTTTRLNTTVELEDGQTFVLGGLVQKDVTGQTLKTPVLGDVPFLGTFFSSKSYQEDETEVVVLVTPHLVDAQDCAQAPKILPGEETRSPDDFELFLEGILEAPRGPRQVFEDHRYIAAYKNSPTAGTFPCAGQCGPNGGCNGGGNGGCSSCNTPAAAPVDAPARRPDRRHGRCGDAAGGGREANAVAAGDAVADGRGEARGGRDAAGPGRRGGPRRGGPAGPSRGGSGSARRPPPRRRRPAPPPAPAEAAPPAPPAGPLPSDLPPPAPGPGDDPK